MAPHSSTLAWKIPWIEKPGRLQSTGSLRVGPNWVTSLSLVTFMHWRRKRQPTPVFLLGDSQGRGSLVGCRLWGRTESDRLKRLSSSSSSKAPYLLSQIPSMTFSQDTLLYVLHTLTKLGTSASPKYIFYFPWFVSFVICMCVFFCVFFFFFLDSFFRLITQQVLLSSGPIQC